MQATHDARTRFIIQERENYRRYVCRKLRNPALAEDLAQETALRQLKNRQAVKKDEEIVKYGYCVARNLIHDQYRRSQRDLPIADLHPMRCSMEDSPIAAALCRTAMSCLSKRNYAIVRLHYWGGFTTAEIGLQLGISEGLVQVSLCRARKAMRKRLAGTNA
jgi:RNA polymerase sigma-70 factor, ECF subfamily